MVTPRREDSSDWATRDLRLELMLDLGSPSDEVAPHPLGVAQVTLREAQTEDLLEALGLDEGHGHMALAEQGDELAVQVLLGDAPVALVGGGAVGDAAHRPGLEEEAAEDGRGPHLGVRRLQVRCGALRHRKGTDLAAH